MSLTKGNLLAEKCGQKHDDTLMSKRQSCDGLFLWIDKKCKYFLKMQEKLRFSRKIKRIG